MQEKEMVNDYLSSINASLCEYGGIIAQTNNQQLRETLQQMRNSDEVRQYNLYNIAKTKGYYKPAADATQQEIDTVKSEFNTTQ